MNAQNIQDWLLTYYGHEKMNPGLDRLKDFNKTQLTQIQLLKPKIVTIAGTNGKGETALCLYKLLCLEKVNVHLWTSPHISHITERFRNKDDEIKETLLWQIISETHQEQTIKGIKLSYYEFLFSVFLRWILLEKSEFLVLEVGLGGRLDGVNILDAKTVLLPSISRDHQEYLGSRYDQILKEKLGVLRPQAELITSFKLKYLRDITRELAKQNDWAWFDCYEGDKNQVKTSFSDQNREIAFLCFNSFYPHSPYQIKNVPQVMIGRGEKIIKNQVEWTLFGSHNVDGVRNLIQYLKDSPYNLNDHTFDELWVGFSDRNQGDLKSMVKMVKSIEQNFKVIKWVSFDSPRTWKGIHGQIDPLIQPWKEVYSKLDANSAKKILVFGSNFLIGEMRSFILFR
jgi:dihydrofolate synthase/folylpolyglutamate synthase